MNKLSDPLRKALVKKLLKPWSPLFKGFNVFFDISSCNDTPQSSEALFAASAKDVMRMLRELDLSEEKLKLHASFEQQCVTVLFETEMSYLDAVIALLRLDRFWEIREIDVL